MAAALHTKLEQYVVSQRGAGPPASTTHLGASSLFRTADESDGTESEFEDDAVSSQP